MSSFPLIQLRGLSKSYAGVRALRDVTLDIDPGEVHAVCGENGAGKSTLIKVLTGVVSPDAGEMLIAGQRLTPGSATASTAAGIAAMHQESTAFPDLNAVDNVFVGRELTRLGGWLLDQAAMRRQTRKILQKLGENFDVDLAVGKLPLAQQQMVAMARALARDCRLLIMDEPTASLSARETRVLLRLVRQLRREGVSVLYVSHRLEEVFEIADRVTIMRDGELVATQAVAEINKDELIRLMVGRELGELTRRQEPVGELGNVALELRGLTRSGAFQNISLAVRSGEIVGLAGLIGAGRSEIVRAVFGMDRYDAGEVFVDGRSVERGSVSAAVAAGLALVPEDRQRQGLVLPMSVSENLSLPTLASLTRGGLVSASREAALVSRQMQDLQVRAASPQAPASTLSGGNQQKLVLGKWLAGQPRVLLLDEPTRGVDVGAKAQVHHLIRELAARGLAVLMISSDLPEILVMSDRIVVMCGGQIRAELDGATATQEQVLALALPAEAEVAA